MKKIMILLVLMGACAPKETPIIVEERVIPTLLDRPKMEQLIRILPLVLRYSTEFSESPEGKSAPDAEYNVRLYQYLYSQEVIAESLKNAGFDDAIMYQKFYDTMIEMYLFILEQPEVVDTAALSTPSHQREVDTLLLKKAKESNNDRLNATLHKLQYELTVYKNLVLVNTFLGQLNALSNTGD